VKEVKHRQVKQPDYYKVEGGEVKRMKKTCNRCGDGTFMAEHKDRHYCGKCGMTVWKKKDDMKKESKGEPKQEPKQEPKHEQKEEQKKEAAPEPKPAEEKQETEPEKKN
jgi:small subunit ribosomal protein S27Ae